MFLSELKYASGQLIGLGAFEATSNTSDGVQGLHTGVVPIMILGAAVTCLSCDVSFLFLSSCDVVDEFLPVLYFECS